jgi:type VI secretion system protein ImpL
VRQQLAKLAQAPVGATPPALPGDDPTLALRAEAQRLPEPISRWLLSLANDATTLRGGSAHQQIVAAYNGPTGPAQFCALAVEGRFPFVPGSPNDVLLDDFARLFAPGGLLDSFFNAQLRPYVDTSGGTWQPQLAEGVVAPVSAVEIAMFQRAAKIRDVFFPGSGSSPTVSFEVTPVSVGPGTQQARLDLSGPPIVVGHDASRPMQITWPGSGHSTLASLAFDPPPADGTGVLQENGPWAMFRLLRRARPQPGSSPELYTLTFQAGDRSASFALRAASLLNPFASGVLQDFHCPTIR